MPVSIASKMSHLFRCDKISLMLVLISFTCSCTNFVLIVEGSRGYNVPEVSNMLDPDVSYDVLLRRLLDSHDVFDAPGDATIGGTIDANDRSITRSQNLQYPLHIDDNDMSRQSHLNNIETLGPKYEPSDGRKMSPLVTKKALKTGTTIVGCIADGGKCVVLAADTRATEGATVADKHCEKVHILAKNIWCCGAGTSADIDALVKRCRYTFMLQGMRQQLVGNIDCDEYEFHRMIIDQDNDGDESRFLPSLSMASVTSTCKFLRDELYQGQGHIGANLVLGGYEYSADRALLVAIHPHGSMDLVPYTALGSGGLAAMAILDSRYRSEISLEDAIELVKDAVAAGISNDLGSGSQIDLCVIKRESVEYKRAVVLEEVLPSQDESIQQKLHTLAEQGEEGDVKGVNGFGSLPYKVKSSKVVLRDEKQVYNERGMWIREKLGINLD